MFIAMEFFGKGDPFFGGSADDRPLGKSGAFLTGSYPRSAIAEFDSEEAARAAAAAAPNKRPGGLISAWAEPAIAERPRVCPVCEDSACEVKSMACGRG